MTRLPFPLACYFLTTLPLPVRGCNAIEGCLQRDEVLRSLDLGCGKLMMDACVARLFT